MLRPYIDEDWTLRRRGGRRARVHQPLGDGLDPEVEPFQGARSEYYEITGLSEHDIVGGALAGHVDERRTGATLEDRSVGLPEAPGGISLDAEGFENLGRNPRQLRARVHQYRPEGSSLAGAGGVLDLDVYAESSLVVGHSSSRSHAE